MHLYCKFIVKYADEIGINLQEEVNGCKQWLEMYKAYQDFLEQVKEQEELEKAQKAKKEEERKEKIANAPIEGKDADHILRQS